MVKQNYVGVVDFHGDKLAKIDGADLSEMKGATGADILILENVTGLHDILDFRASTGTPIPAAGAGRVVARSFNRRTW